jgi:hypothetical protein
VVGRHPAIGARGLGHAGTWLVATLMRVREPPGWQQACHATLPPPSGIGTVHAQARAAESMRGSIQRAAMRSSSGSSLRLGSRRTWTSGWLLCSSSVV